MANQFFSVCLFVGTSVLSFNMLAKEGPKTEVGATFSFDYSTIDGNSRDSLENSTEFNSEIRRARVGLKHSHNKKWDAKLQLNFNEDEESEIGDAYVRYKGVKSYKLTMGQFKEPFGLENMTSSKNISFLERSMASNAFGLGRNKGLMLSLTPGESTYSFAFMNLEGKEDESAPYAVTGRATWAAISNDTQILHLGLSGSFRMLDGEEFEVDERAELHSMEKIVESGEIATDQIQLSSVEVAWVDGPFSLQGEYMSADLQAVDASESVKMDGYYMQASYFITGEQRRYKNGAFASIKPESKKGAWELTSRFSVLDISETDDGIELRSTTLGLNYYVDENIKLTGNLLRSESSEPVNGSSTGNGVGFRVQYLY
jgi:phosphate-selective porin OprO/OprP